MLAADKAIVRQLEGRLMRLSMPGGLTAISGALLAASGAVSVAITLPIGAVLYEVDPHGLFGHIGIVAGGVAIVLGAFLWWFGRVRHSSTGRLFLAGIVSIVMGHAGAVQEPC